MHHHQDARFYVFHSPLLTQSTGCLKKTEIHRIKHLQIGFPSAMGRPSLKIVSYQDYAKLSIPKSCLQQSLTPQHTILVMIFGLKMISPEAPNWAQRL